MIEFHEAGEWTAVYVDGRLVQVGDSYLADEWLQQRFGVKVVQDSAFLLGQDQKNGVAKTLDEVKEFAAARDQRAEMANRMREEARRLVAEANALEA